MPADVLRDLHPCRSRTNAPLQQRVGTIGLLPLLPKFRRPDLRVWVNRNSKQAAIALREGRPGGCGSAPGCSAPGMPRLKRSFASWPDSRRCGPAAPLIELSRLGVTRAMRGEATESVAAYQRFLSDGSKADADLPVMAQAKCELQREEAVARQPAGSGGVVNFAICVYGS
jgi:hypothetical protein